MRKDCELSSNVCASALTSFTTVVSSTTLSPAISPTPTFPKPTPTSTPVPLSVDELKGTIRGALNGNPIRPSDILVTVVEDSPGKLDWTVYFADGQTEGTYAPVFPALVLPAGWLVAHELPDSLVQNGLIATGGQPFNATVTISFLVPTEEQLTIEISSQGLTRQGDKNTIDYSIELSGSYPRDFDGLSVFPVTIKLEERSSGTVQATGILADDIELRFELSYSPTTTDGPLRTVFLTVASGNHSDNGTALSFDTTSQLFADWPDLFRK